MNKKLIGQLLALIVVVGGIYLGLKQESTFAVGSVRLKLPASETCSTPKIEAEATILVCGEMKISIFDRSKEASLSDAIFLDGHSLNYTRSTLDVIGGYEAKRLQPLASKFDYRNVYIVYPSEKTILRFEYHKIDETNLSPETTGFAEGIIAAMQPETTTPFVLSKDLHVISNAEVTLPGAVFKETRFEPTRKEQIHDFTLNGQTILVITSTYTQGVGMADSFKPINWIYRDIPATDTTEIGGIPGGAALFYSDGCLDGSMCGTPFVAATARVAGTAYTFVFYGDEILSAEEQAILSAVRFQ